MTRPTVTIVTPWLAAEELRAGYEAAVAAGEPDAVYEIENAWAGPPGDTVAFGPPVRFVRFAHENLGFARASNIGLRKATTDAVLFLNNDIVHTRAGWLDPIREALRPGVLVGAQLDPGRHAAVDGRPQPYLPGWCLAGMRADLLDLGGFDESFEEPAYYGDNDLCVRARARGMRLVQADVGLRHLGNYTTRRIDVGGVSSRNYARYAARTREVMTVRA